MLVGSITLRGGATRWCRVNRTRLLDAVDRHQSHGGLCPAIFRTGAPIVPLVLGGTHELYRSRRFRLDIGEPVTWQELAGLDPAAPAPEPWSSAERRVAHRVTLAFHERTKPGVAASHLATTPKPGVRKRWRWLTSAWH